MHNIITGACSVHMCYKDTVDSDNIAYASLYKHMKRLSVEISMNITSTVTYSFHKQELGTVPCVFKPL